MRTDIIRLYKTIHTWTGIVAGMALFIAFYAGALTMFKGPLGEWLDPAASDSRNVALTEMPILINQVLASQPAAGKEFMLTLPDAQPGQARLSWTEMQQDNKQVVFASLHDGAMRITPSSSSSLPSFIDTLHRVVGLPVDNDAFRLPMGIISGLYALALISGVIVLLPTLIKDFFALRIGRNLKRMWLDTHNVIGIVSLPFHIVMALTATVFAFHDDIYDLQDKLFYHGAIAAQQQQQQKKPAQKPAAPTLPARAALPLLTPDELLRRAHDIAPSFTPKTLQYAQIKGPRPTVRVWGNDAQGIARSTRGGFLAMDPYTGKVLSTDYLPGHQSALGNTITSFFALHMGTFGGATITWLYFLLALAGAFLCYTGCLLWIESRRKSQRRNQPERPGQSLSAMRMAAATVGVCLGCICGIALTVSAGRWLYGVVDDLPFWHMSIYYATFFACIAWSWWIGAARAGVHLSWLAALLSISIPLTSLVSLTFPASGLWHSTTAAAIGVDLTATAAALIFVLIGYKARRRSLEGAADSVWSIHAVTG